MNKSTFLNTLHIFNDGFEASLILLLPFIAKELHINIAQVGFIGSSINLTEVLLALPAIYIARKFGGLKTLLGALLLYSIGYITTSFIHSYQQILILFILAGIGFGLFHSIAFSLVAKWTEKNHRGRAMGNFTALGDVGKTFLSAIAPFLVTYVGWRLTGLSYGISALLLFFLLTFLFSKYNENKNVINTNKEHKSVSFFQLFTHMPFILTNLTGFLDTMASGTIFIFLPFLLLKRGISPSILGIFTAIYFIGNVFGKVVLGKFADKYRSSTVFIFSEICMALMIFLLANSTSVVIIIVSSLVLGVFTKGTLPIIKSMLSDSLEKHNMSEKGFGINSTIGSAANTIAPTALGFIAYKYGIVTAFEVNAGLAIAAVIPAFLFSKLK